MAAIQLGVDKWGCIPIHNSCPNKVTVIILYVLRMLVAIFVYINKSTTMKMNEDECSKFYFFINDVSNFLLLIQITVLKDPENIPFFGCLQCNSYRHNALLSLYLHW